MVADEGVGVRGQRGHVPEADAFVVGAGGHGARVGRPREGGEAG